MSKTTDQDVLVSMVRKYGLSEVRDMLANVCFIRAMEIWEDWDKQIEAKDWVLQGRKLLRDVDLWH